MLDGGWWLGGRGIRMGVRDRLIVVVVGQCLLPCRVSGGCGLVFVQVKWNYGLSTSNTMVMAEIRNRIMLCL